MIVGERPDLSGIREDVDVYVASANAFWERLIAGDDYIQWTLRFGCILHDDGILQAASRHIEENGLTSSAERKLSQAHLQKEVQVCRLYRQDRKAGSQKHAHVLGV